MMPCADPPQYWRPHASEREDRHHRIWEETMQELLDRTTRLTRNQWKIVSAAAIGDALEFFDYYLISYVLAFIIKPWQLTFGQSGIILLSSGVGAIAGAYIWGYVADRIGRRTVFMATVINFSLATGLLALTPDGGWIYLTALRFFVGFGVGGLYRYCGQCSILGAKRQGGGEGRFALCANLLRRSLLLHVLLDDRQRSPAARDDAVGPGPEDRFSVHVPQLLAEVAADQPRAGRLHVVDEPR
jgi:hypothetical protein